MNSAGYLVIGGLSPFGDIYRLINLGVLTRSASLAIGLGLFCCGFVVISLKIKQILNTRFYQNVENSVIAFWSLVPLLTLLAILGNNFQVIFILPSFLPMILSFFLKTTITSELITYLTDEEYENIFFDFCSLRNKIGMKLIKYGLLESENILDIAAGHGLLSIAIKKCGYNNNLVAIGLNNDMKSFGQLKKRNSSMKNIQYIECFSSQLGFKNESFDCIINFLGLEDINMTSGERGVKETLLEISRIVKKEGIIEIAIQVEGKKPSSKIFWDLWEKTGLNCIFYSPEYYVSILESAGCFLIEQFSLKTYKKLTENQARQEIKFACEEAPKIFSEYGVEARPFQKVWEEFKPRIRKYGLGFWPEFNVLIFKKKR
jgi:ubiquinone/menaquinone biosynthesis C-methylase UbiE